MRNSMNHTGLIRTAILASTLLAAFAVPAWAQMAPVVPTLTASGDGSVSGAPDIALISLGVLSEAANVKDALAANATDMNAAIQAIKDAGVETKDIATSGLSVEPIYSDASREPNNTAKITGFRVSNQVTVTIRKLASAGALLDKVVTAGANRVTGVSFQIDKADALRDQAVQAAIKEARRRAELMAAAAGVKLGAVQQVMANDGGAMPVFRAQMAMKADSTPILGGQQQITANATIIYEIAPK
jgi:uncharacterized protein YggE